MSGSCCSFAQCLLLPFSKEAFKRPFTKVLLPHPRIEICSSPHHAIIPFRFPLSISRNNRACLYWVMCIAAREFLVKAVCMCYARSSSTYTTRLAGFKLSFLEALSTLELCVLKILVGQPFLCPYVSWKPVWNMCWAVLVIVQCVISLWRREGRNVSSFKMVYFILYIFSPSLEYFQSFARGIFWLPR